MNNGHVALSQLNRADRQGFVTVCGPLFEHSPWVADRTWERRPFGTLSVLHRQLVATMEMASEDEQINLICAHPDLVGRLAARGGLTTVSAGEQAAAGLDSLSAEEVTLFRGYNREYRDKFGFPFVICARENRKEAILRAFPERLGQSRKREISTALSEIAKIAWLRLQDAVTEG